MKFLAFAAALLALQDAGLAAKRDEAAAALEKARGLKFEAPLKVREGGRREYGAMALENAKLLYGEDLASAEKALRSLGLVGSRIKLSIAIPMLAVSGGVQVFARDGELVFVDADAPVDELVYKMTVAALDASRPFKDASAKLGTNFDAQMALAATRHGDADMSKRLHWSGQGPAAKLPDDHLKALVDGATKWEREDSRWASAVVARLFVRSSDFIWRRGGIFMETVRRGGGMEAVEKIHESPPPSTEQILHPEKLGKDAPVVVDLAVLEKAALEKGLKLVYRSTLGELGVAIFLETHLKEDVEAASAGWGGDSLAHFEDGAGAGFSVWATAWDTENDAREFQAVADKVAAAIAPSDKTRRTLVARRGRNVAFLFSFPADQEEVVLGGLWDSKVGVNGEMAPYGSP